VAIPHIVVLTAASLTLLTLPCVVVAVVRADAQAALRRYRRRRPEVRVETLQLRTLDLALRDVPVPLPIGGDGPSFEQIAYDLRRLGLQRRSGLCLESVKWQAAVLRAYDQRLSLACRCLGLPEHLEQLVHMDRDLERLRVESQLQAAGLVLH
jgi:hypothetical protein